jgi:hypothetical protein
LNTCLLTIINYLAFKIDGLNCFYSFFPKQVKELNIKPLGAQESATQRKEAAQKIHAARQDGGDLTEFNSLPMESL